MVFWFSKRLKIMLGASWIKKKKTVISVYQAETAVISVTFCSF